MAKQELVPRVFRSARTPRYPRALSIGTMLLLSACCKSTNSESESTDPADTVDPTMLPGGAPPPVYTEASTDAGASDAADAAAHSGDAAPDVHKPRPKRVPMPPGTAPPPFSSR